MVISRDDFVENYPQLLLEVTMDNDTVMGEMDVDGDYGVDWQYPGIDICFRDLSLNIQIGENNIRVVDEVTGRIRAKTMTALMGGSGAGKLSSSVFPRIVFFNIVQRDSPLIDLLAFQERLLC